MGRVKGASPPALLDKSYKAQDTNNKQTLSKTNINTFLKGLSPSAWHRCTVSKGARLDIRPTNKRVVVYISSGNQFLEIVLTRKSWQRIWPEWASGQVHPLPLNITAVPWILILLCQSRPITICLFSIAFTWKQENILGKKSLLV